MRLTIVVAASENNVIGVNNALPWHLPDDLKFFKSKTLEKPVLMGRKTFESLGKPLPKRLNIVLSRSEPQLPEGVLHFQSAESALEFLQAKNTAEVCVIGGGQIFEMLLPHCQTVYLTRVHTVLDGSVFFLPLPPEEWKKVWSEDHAADERHAFAFTFEQYERVAP